MPRTNDTLAEQRCPPVARLTELTRYRDVPCERIGEYCDDREVISFMVNRLLLNVSVPSPVRGVPELVNDVQVSDLVEIASHVDLNGSLEFIANRKVPYLSSMTIGGRMFHVSNRHIDDLLRQVLRVIRFPIESNTVELHVGREMLQLLQFNDLVSVGPIMRGLKNYNVMENAIFVSRKVWRAAVDALMNFELPLIGNEPQDTAINAIFADSAFPTDCIGMVGQVRIRAIDCFTITDENRAANAVHFEDEWPLIGRFPLTANVCPVGDIAEIASILDKFNDVIPSLPGSGFSLFEHYATLDERFYAALVGQECVSDLYREIVLPLGSNSADSIIDDILVGLKFDSVAEFVPMATDPFDRFVPKASEYYGNQPNIDSVFEQLWSEIGFPVCANEVPDGLADEIIEAHELMKILTEIPELEPLHRFELGDTLLYTSQTIANNLIDCILLEFDSELPICQNETLPGIGAEITDGLDCCDCPDWFELGALNLIVPSERRIDFEFAPIQLSILNTTTCHLPIEITRDFCNDATINEIINMFQPFCFFAFSMTDTTHLQVYEAPEEVEESLDDIATKLMGMVLQTDVLPFLPAWADIESKELDAIVAPIVNEVSLAGVAALRVDRLCDLKQTEVPPTITPNMIVHQLLWQFVLPECPVMRAVDIDDFLDTLPPGQDPHMDLEEPLPEEAVAMLSSYRSRARHQRT
jgi:hypothetical protein